MDFQWYVYQSPLRGINLQLLENVLVHGSVFAVLLTVYLLGIMRGLNPRIWAFSDYPREITDHVPPQTARERKIGAYIAIPFFILGIGFPLVSTMMLESLYGGSIPLLDAFLNILIVGTITPDWVIIPGTEHMRDKEYKDFRLYHAKDHARALILLVILSLLFAAAVVYL